MTDQAKKSTSKYSIKYKDLLEFLPEVVFETDLNLNLIYTNEIGFEKFGYTKEDFQNGINLADVIAPESIEVAINTVKSILQGSISKPSEYMLQRKDKTTFYGRVHSRPVMKDNRPVGLRGIVSDISELKETQRQLHDSEEKYRSIVENSHESIIVLNDQSRIVYANPVTSEVFGWSEEELLNRDFQNFIHESSLPLVADRYSRRLKGEEVPKNYTFNLLRKDGEIRLVETISETFKDSKGNKITLARTVDVTEQKKLEEDRIELEKQRLKFIETTSHELRTPLTSLKGFIELLQLHGDELTLKKQSYIFGVLNKNLDKLARLIMEVSDLSKFERGMDLSISKENWNFHKFIQDEIVLYKNLLGEQFEYEIPDNIQSIDFLFDKERISQVIANIMDNAMKNTPDKIGKIFLVVSRTAYDSVSISIKDNGAGITKEHLPTIFNQFVTIPTKYSVVGSGIGLFLCKLLVEKHGGTISAESEGLDEGSVFTMNLPLNPHKSEE
ncbi:MAG: PAS domain S-box protein [Candidatus Hodarchaeales archaeon]|jgi:PAS domain S-box-containing protein